MKYTTLGNSGIKVSRICMGGMSFGDPTNGQHTWTLNQDQTTEIIKMGLENGITFLIQRLPTKMVRVKFIWEMPLMKMQTVMTL